MLTGLRQRWAWRAALRRVRRRTPRPWHPDPALRRVLRVLPDDDEAAKPAWQLVERLALRQAQTLAVLTGVNVGAVPVDYLSRVRPLNEREIGRIGLPKREVLREIWAFDPDVAIDLAGPDDLSAALLVGASSAAFRVGPAGPALEPFFEVMVAFSDDPGAPAHALEQVLGRIHPTVLPKPGAGP
jgi:hypothetical protein